MDTAPAGRDDLPALQVPPLGRAEETGQTITLTTMNNDTEQRRITGLAFKDEGENNEGVAIGTLTDQDGNHVVPGQRLVTKSEALRIARDLRVPFDDF